MDEKFSVIEFTQEELAQILTLVLRESHDLEEANDENLDIIGNLTDDLNLQQGANEDLVRAVMQLAAERDEARKWARRYYQRYQQLLKAVGGEW